MGRLHPRGRGAWGGRGAPSGRVRGALAALVAALTLLGCDRAERPGAEAGDESGLTGGALVFSDDFEREALGESYRATSPTWRIEDGAVQVADARNAPLWLDLPLPDEVRVEFSVTALHEHGDLKFEIFGDGEQHESGYVLIYGGWQNSTTCIARLDEHGSDRLDAAEHVPVETGRTYAFAVVRTDNRLRWFIDGEHVLTYDDSAPLEGAGHRYFAFNNWAVPVRFENLRVYDLSQ